MKRKRDGKSEPKPTTKDSKGKQETKKKDKIKDLSKVQSTPGKIAFGSYSRLLYGLTISERKLKAEYTFAAHIGSITTLAISPDKHYLLTSGSDELLKIWDLRKLKQVGELQILSTCTAICFPSTQYALLGFQDGTLVLYRTSDWAELKTLHTKAKEGVQNISSLACHPQGSLAMSIGHDRTLRLWDLVNGRQVAVTKFKGEKTRLRSDFYATRPHLVKFLENRVLVGWQYKVDMFDLDMSLLYSFESNEKWLAMEVVKRDNGDLLLVGGEDKKVQVFNLKSRECVGVLEGHSNRIKGIQHIHPDYVCTISSDGNARLFDLGALSPETLALDTFDTHGARLTCLAAV